MYSPLQEKKIKPEKIVSYKKTTVDLDKVPVWTLFSSFFSKLFGYSADTFEYYESYNIYGKRNRADTITETLLVTLVLAAFIMVVIFSIYSFVKIYMGHNDDKILVKVFNKIHTDLGTTPSSPFDDRLVKSIETSTSYLFDIQDHQNAGTVGLSNGSGPIKEDYIKYFDFNSFIFAEPGGGLYPSDKKYCTTFTGGAQAQAPVLVPQGPDIVQIDRRVSGENLKVINKVNLQLSELTKKINNYFRKFDFKGSSYIVFKTDNSSTINTPFASIKKISAK